MKKFKLLSTGILLSFALFSQKNDYNWVLGYKAECLPFYECKSLLFNFKEYPKIVAEKNNKMGISFSTTSLSDRNGNLLLYSNGEAVFNSKFKLMNNGGSLDSGYILGVGDTWSKSVSALIQPDIDSIAFIFANQFENDVVFNAAWNALAVSKINMALGDGKVITKGLPLLSGLQLCQFSLFKHANGRDWWLLVPENHSNKYYRFLIDNIGIHGPFIQNYGFYGTRGPYERTVSLQGDRYVIPSYRTNKGVWLYHLDRCEGTLSNEQLIYVAPSDTFNGYNSVAFSPSGRFLYVYTCPEVSSPLHSFMHSNTMVLQYDLWSSDIKASVDTIAQGNPDPLVQINPDYFLESLTNAPDGKIYLKATNWAMHTIDFPDRKGAACRFRALMPNFGGNFVGGLLPNCPNPRLGPIDGSICDSLNLNNNPLAGWRWDQEDSSNVQQVTFTDYSSYEPATWHWDFGDGNTSQDTSPVHTYALPGVYYVCMSVCNQYSCDTMCRYVNVGVSPTQEPQNQATLFDIHPNPTSGILYIETDVSSPYTLEAVNILGSTALQRDMPPGAGVLSVAELPPGMYWLRLRQAGRVLGVRKVVIER